VDLERFTALTRAISAMLSRRSLAGALGLSTAGLSGLVEARKKRKRKKRKNKQKCGKAGGKPVKGKCCKGSIRVDGRCRRCDVCARGCAFSSVQDAIEAASAGDTIALCAGTYRGNLEIDGILGIATPLRLVGAGDGSGASDTIVQGSGDAGVMFIAENVVSLEHLRITGGLGLGGGGIVNFNGTVELIGCTVSENEAVGNGGGIHNDAGTLTLRNSTVSDNEAGVRGGGVFNSGTLLLIASDISGNRSSHGGGVFNDASMTADAASRITGNMATGDGGGIYDTGGTVTLVSSAIVSGNIPNNCAGPAAVPNCID
jgi:hypothetical protein